MTDLYKAAGVNISEQNSVSGNGYTTTYTNQTGMEFKEYKQTKGSYSTIRIWDSGTIASNRMWTYGSCNCSFWVWNK